MTDKRQRPKRPRRSRCRVFREFGFVSYEEYLASPLWKKIRDRVLDRDGHLCCRCGKTATQVHHKSYREPVILGDDDGDLVSVCSHCHEFAEFDETGKKLSTKEANELLEAKVGIAKAAQTPVEPDKPFVRVHFTELPTDELRRRWSGFNGHKRTRELADKMAEELARRGAKGFRGKGPTGREK